MSQEYTPVTWQDETTSTQGTLINAERLNQMQEAHHFADGFREVDAVPTADPGVDYHQVVYCTADTTFYRWNGAEWTKDIDDDTKALLQQEITRATERENEIAGDLATETTNRTNADTALGTRITNEATARGNADDAINLAVSTHVGDHSNPHEVTKAQVGLGNCDNTADLDKPVSTAVQSALDTKASASDLTTLEGRVDGTEGSITTLQGKVGTLESADTQNVKLTGEQTIPGPKTFSSAITAAAGLVGNVTGSLIGNADTATRATTAASADHADAATTADSASSADKAIKLGTADVGTDTKPIKLVGGTATAVANDLVDTASAQTVGGPKTWTGAQTISSTLAVSGAVTMASTLVVNGTASMSGQTDHTALITTNDSVRYYNTALGNRAYYPSASTAVYPFAVTPGATNSNGHANMTFQDTPTLREIGAYMFAPTIGWVHGVLSSTPDAGAYFDVPTPGASAPTTAAATLAWCADSNGLNNLLHTNAAEEFSGAKTGRVANNTAAFITKVPGINVTNPPSSEIMGQLRFTDTNNTTFAIIRAGYGNDGLINVSLILRNNDGTSKYVTLGKADN